MKACLHRVIPLIFLISAPAEAKSDADVTLVKVKKVTIEETVITIVADAKM